MPFPTTSWTLLADATVNGEAEGRAALQRLCLRYRPAVLVFVKSRGLAQEDAEDMTQDFFHKLLDSRMWKRAERDRGLFRNFLCGALHKNLNEDLRSRMRLKRGGGQEGENFHAQGVEDECSMEANVPPSFDVAWAEQLLNTALQAVEADFLSQGKKERYAVLREFLPGASNPPQQEEAADRLGITVNNLRVELTRLRQQLRGALRAEVAKTVSSPHEVDEELAHLQKIMMSPGSALPAS